MAILIPSLGFARFDSRGELRLAERLKDFLEENAVVWHNLPVGPLNRHPDFIIVHPASGLLVLEVKDWRLETIVSADKTKVELLTHRGVVRESNPLEQARRYTLEVVRTLERDGQLLFPPGHRFAGRPIVPFGFGAVFTNITRRQFDQTDLKEVFAEHLCLFKDEMTEGVDPEEFRTRLWRMVHPRLEQPLFMPQFDRLRALLFPEIRVRQIALPLEEAPRADSSDRTLAVMDQIGARVAQILARHDVPIDMARDNRNRISIKRLAVQFLSMHSAKGLEFPCVAIARLGSLGRHGETVEECVRLTYVGVTRATHEALLTYSNESALVQRLIA